MAKTGLQPFVMTTKAIDITNMLLMLIACVLAFAVPFELFLFSYAVLGPLHYLTEIGWLHKRNYFSTGKFDYLWLVVLSFFLFMFSYVYTHNYQAAYFMIYLAFLSALAFILFKDTGTKMVFILMAGCVGILLMNFSMLLFLFALFLPTLVHSFVFTGLFITYGALKNRSLTGLISVIVFLFCGLSFFIWQPVFNFYNVTDYARNAYVMGGQGFVNLSVAFIHTFHLAGIQLYGLGKDALYTVFHSKAGLSVGRFIAFSYTYHYLNWFSKTNIIKWHLVPKKWLLSIVILWMASVGLYIYDFRTGLILLYFLAYLHVFLEFPLNYRSIIGIGNELKGLGGVRSFLKKAV